MRLRRGIAALLLVSAAGRAAAWGDAGHEIVAAIARAHLTPAARRAADALLAQDPDTLTKPDFISRSTWADRFRDSDRDAGRTRYLGTRQWHFVNVELDDGDLDAACRGHPPLASGTRASVGPADACIVDKIGQFAAELRDRRLPLDERRMALKFLIHLVGDLHQPLHAADRHDAGGNLLAVRDATGQSDVANLHAWWDVRIVDALGRSPARVAANLDRRIGRRDAQAWAPGTPAEWALETWVRARTTAYALADQKTAPGADGKPVIRLDAVYLERARPVAEEQLSKAGVRLAALLNAALGGGSAFEHQPEQRAQHDEHDLHGAQHEVGDEGAEQRRPDALLRMQVVPGQLREHDADDEPADRPQDLPKTRLTGRAASLFHASHACAADDDACPVRPPAQGSSHSRAACRREGCRRTNPNKGSTDAA